MPADAYVCDGVAPEPDGVESPKSHAYERESPSTSDEALASKEQPRKVHAGAASAATGAVFGGGETVTDVAAVLVAPWLSMTVRTTGKVPAAA